MYFVSLHIQVVDAYSLAFQPFHWAAPGPTLSPFRDLSLALEDFHVHARVSLFLALG